MLEARVQELEKQLAKDFKHNEIMMTRLIPFLRNVVAKKEATEKKEDDDDEEEEQVA
jgi:hypothetical protein